MPKVPVGIIDVKINEEIVGRWSKAFIEQGRSELGEVCVCGGIHLG